MENEEIPPADSDGDADEERGEVIEKQVPGCFDGTGVMESSLPDNTFLIVLGAVGVVGGFLGGLVAVPGPPLIIFFMLARCNTTQLPPVMLPAGILVTFIVSVQCKCTCEMTWWSSKTAAHRTLMESAAIFASLLGKVPRNTGGLRVYRLAIYLAFAPGDCR